MINKIKLFSILFNAKRGFHVWIYDGFISAYERNDGSYSDPGGNFEIINSGLIGYGIHFWNFQKKIK